jgi:hypothetical protein
MMEQRYRALRIIGTIYKVLGGLAGLLTILIVITVCGTSLLGGAALQSMTRQFGYEQGVGGFLGSAFGGLVASVFVIIYGGGVSVTLYGFGEGIYLLLALEENTRATAEALMRRAESAG